MSKSSRELYTCGCSFTAKDWVITDANRMEGYETGPHPMWPEILAGRLDLEPVNMACPGMGNDYILSTSMKYILDNHENIELVAIQWSQLTRMWVLDIPDYGYFNPSVWLNEEDRVHDRWGPDFVGFPYIFGDPWTASRKLMTYVLRNPDRFLVLYKKYLREVSTLQTLCEKLGVNYIFGQGFEAHQAEKWLHLNSNIDMDRVLREFIQLPDFDKIDREKFMGWPCVLELGGTTMTDGLPDFDPHKNRMNPIDNHPSAHGQHLIADQFYNKYKQLYG